MAAKADIAPIPPILFFCKNIMLRLLLVASLFLLVSAHAEQSACSIPGEPLHWAADYCMYKAATDDFAHPKVAKCFQKQTEPPTRHVCAAKVKYKKEICAVVVKNGSYKGSEKQCLQDKDFAGPTVQKGGL